MENISPSQTWKAGLLIADAENGETKEVDHDPNWEITEYVFSPDGKWLAYTKLGDNRYQQVHLYCVADGKHGSISSGFTMDYSPSWDPSGKYLYFLSNRYWNPRLDDIDRQFTVNKSAKPCLVILTKEGKSPFLPEDVLGEDEKDSKDKKDSTTKPTSEPSTEPSSKSDEKTKSAKAKKELPNVKVDLDGSSGALSSCRESKRQLPLV